LWIHHSDAGVNDYGGYVVSCFQIL